MGEDDEVDGPSAITPALSALREATRRLNYSLPTLIAETGIWAHPAEHAARVTTESPTGAVNPTVRRARVGSGEAAGAIVEGIRLDRNNYAGAAIRAAMGIPREELEGYEACHIWPGSCYDARYHTVIANLVLIPSPLAGLTDHDPDVISALKYRAFELYAWHPVDAPPPSRPEGYPSNWREPAPRDRPRGPPRRTGQPTHRDFMRELFRKHGGDKEAVVKAYAAAERIGEISRSSNARGMSAIEYARRLWLDGTKKGWLMPSPQA